MAVDTPPDLSSLVIYQVFPRNHGPTGSLSDITADLDRIVGLGADVLYLMPIHPIGVEGRKGSQGSPYAISDYRTLHPDLGTEQDFDLLVAAAHDAGLRVIIDVVCNHTSPDSVLISEHPEFFHRDADGQPFPSVPEWHDIVDLKHPDPELARYLIDSLAIWVRRGVDGFRCDVASLVPVEFWLQARRELAELKPGLVWLAESVSPDWVSRRRAVGLPTASDSELFEAFDISYQYDLFSIWQAAVDGQVGVGRVLEMLRWQYGSWRPQDAKLRFVENHDQYRIMYFAPSRPQAMAWTAFMACVPGPLMIYAGQEAGARKWPSLFEPDPVAWGDYELSPFVSAVARLKKHPAQRAGSFWVLADEPCIQIAWSSMVADGRLAPATDGGTGLYGVFNVGGVGGRVPVQLPDGEYADMLSATTIAVDGGQAEVPTSAVVLEFGEPFPVELWKSALLDVSLHVEVLGDPDA